MMAYCGSIVTVKGSSTAPSVSMFTPGIAPNSIPPNSPSTKMVRACGSANSAVVPVRKPSIIPSTSPAG